MARQRTRTWSVPTSPRSPYKLRDTINLVAKFEGKLWNQETQRAFALELAQAEFYEGSVSENHPDFAARDRVNRAPKAFGFVRLGRNRPLEITDAGRQLMSGRGEDDLMLRQLLKWGYPSPNHGEADYRELFCIRPFLEILRLTLELDGLSKDELMLWGVPLIRYQDYTLARDGIQAYRVARAQARDKVERGALLQATRETRAREVYAEELAAGLTETRQSTDASTREFLRVKMSNWRDYADSAMRYFLATGLFTLSDSGRLYRLTVLPERRAEAQALLRDTPRDPFSGVDADAFYAYLGDPQQPTLPGDDLGMLQTRVQTLWEQLPERVHRARAFTKADLERETDLLTLREREAELRCAGEADAAATQQQELQRAEAVTEITEMFTQIRARQVPDAPLYFEWNVWRALSALNDGEIINNFEMDRLGQPRKTAPGGGADVRCVYPAFHLAVEVTLSNGATQYKMEGEPVNRHVGLLQKSMKDAGDTRPVYGLFVAPTLNPTVIAHFYAQFRTPLKIFGGAVSVVPLALSDFEAMLRRAQPKMPLSSSLLAGFFARARELALKSEDEDAWHQSVRDLAEQWPLAA